MRASCASATVGVCCRVHMARKNDASKTGQVHLRVTDAERRLLDRVVAARRSTMTAVVLELVDREHRRLVRERGERNEATPPKEEA